jgi:hypothetical protein
MSDHGADEAVTMPLSLATEYANLPPTARYAHQTRWRARTFLHQNGISTEAATLLADEFKQQYPA